MALLLERVVRCGIAFDRDLACLNLKGLFCVRRCDEGTADDEGGTDIDFPNGLEIRQIVMVDNLQGLKKTAVADGQKAEGLGIAIRAHPAA